MTQSLRILVLEPSGQLWGSERVLLELLDSLPAESVEPIVCCPPGGPIIDQLNRRGVQVIPAFTAELHKQNRLARVKALWRFLKTIRQVRPDVIYLSQAGAVKFGAVARKLLRVPVVVGVKLAEDIRYIASESSFSRNIDRFICVSNFIHDELRDSNTICQEQLELIYDPFVPQFDWDQVGPIATPDNLRMFACIARLAYSKGQDVVIEALAELQAQNVDCNVNFVGDADSSSTYGDELRELSRRRGVEDRCNWLGSRENFHDYGSSCVAWLCPSRRDPFPRVMLSAVDAGMFPIAWSGSGGPAEFIEASGGGILYHEQTACGLAQAMNQAMNLTPQERTQLVERGRAFVADRCNPVNNAQATLKVWRDCLDSNAL